MALTNTLSEQKLSQDRPIISENQNVLIHYRKP